MKRSILLIIALFTISMVVAQKTVTSVILKNGTVLKGYIKKIETTDGITIELAGVDTKIKMDDVALIEDSQQKTGQDNSQIVKQERIFVMPEDPLKGYKGFLLAKGNNVYVSGDDNEFEKMAVEELRKLLFMDGFWNVVDDINEAHFTIGYLIDRPNSHTVTGSGELFVRLKIKRVPEKATLIISSWRSNSLEELGDDKIKNIFSTRSNLETARKLYNKAIRPLQKDIENNKLSRRIKKRFTIN